jgi:hypothetical protein
MPKRIFSKNPKIFLQKWHPKYNHAALDLQTRIFDKYVDLDNAFDISKEFRKDMVKRKSLHQIDFDHDISFCAIHNETDHFIAGLKGIRYHEVDMDPKAPKLTHSSSGEEKLSRIVTLFDLKFEEHFKRLGLTPNPKEFMHFFIGFADEAYMNQGIYTELNNFAEQTVKNDGIKHVFRMLTSESVQNVMLNKRGFEALEEIYIKDIVIDGYRPLEKFMAENPKKETSKVILAYKKL